MAQRRDREFYARGLEDYHDPTAGLGGAPPARSALTLRLWLAGFGFVCATVGAVLAGVAGATVPAVVLGAIAAVAIVNVSWVAYRKWRGEPG